MWGVGLRAQHSSGFSAARTNRAGHENGPHDKGHPTDPVAASISQLAPASGPRLAAHRVRALRRRQPGGQPGRHAARPARARHRARRDRRDARPGRSTARRIAADPSLRGVERLEATLGVAARRARCSPGGRLSRAWNLLTRDDHLFSNQGLRDDLRAGATPRHLRGPRDPAAGGRHRPRHRRRGRVRARPARARAAAPAPRCRASSRPIRHDGRTLVDGAVVDTVPLWHALAGPVDRIYVLNVAGDLMDRPLRSPHRRRRPRVRDQPQAAVRPRAAERARERRGGACSPPRSTTASSSTSPAAGALMDDAHDLAAPGARRGRAGQAPAAPAAAARSGAATPRSADHRFAPLASALERRRSESGQMSEAASRAKWRKAPGRIPSRSTITPVATSTTHRGGADPAARGPPPPRRPRRHRRR